MKRALWVIEVPVAADIIEISLRELWVLVPSLGGGSGDNLVHEGLDVEARTRSITTVTDRVDAVIHPHHP